LGISFDRVAEIYDDTRGLPLDVMDDVLEALSRELDKSALVLDAGVGTGRFAQPLQAKGYQVVGVDISEKMLDKAKEKKTTDLVRGDLLRLPFRNDVFGVCLSVHVLHLISDWKKVLAEVGRVTTDKFVSVTTNHEESPAFAIRQTYEKACEELGFSTHHVGLRERELPEVVAADSIRLVVVHEHPMEVAQLISGLQNRIMSCLWRVPEDIHEQAIEAVKEEFEGVETLIESEAISLMVWKADKLRNLNL